ncbi:MAG: hypothetical protein HDT28_07355 [Clostridiales bacterium]|nr:hypothetical protein [Clostridiales bacterium]
MLESLYKLFHETLGLTANLWLFVFLAVVVVAFVVALVMGLVSGKLKQTTSAMKSAVAHPDKAVAAMKKMPQSVKTRYKNARLSNVRPSILVSEDVCVNEPYKHSLISKVWLVVLVATLICAALAFVISPIAVLPEGAKDAGFALLEEGEEAAEVVDYTWLAFTQNTAPALVLMLGGILILIGGIVGRAVYGKAAKLYEKFAPVVDGDVNGGAAAAHQAYSEPQATYAEPQQTYEEPQAVYAEPQQAYEEPQAVYAEPQQEYVQPQAAYAEQPVYEAAPVVEQQESDEEIRRKAREEALRQARAAQQAQQQQAAQAQQQAQARPQQTAQAQTAGGGSSADEVIAEIERISQQGASREAMREVATRLQKERAKPENSSPETKKRLNEALSKLLKAMSAAK